MATFDPINYTQQVQQPFEAALQGYSAGAAIRDDQAKQQQLAEQRAAQQAAQAQQQRVLSSLINNPAPTARDYADAALAVPSMREHFDQAWKTLSTDQAQASVTRDSQLLAALQSDPTIAKQLADAHATSLRNAGRADEAKQAETFAGLIEQSPGLARTMLGMKLAAAPGGDKIIEGVTKLGAEGRAAALAPFEQRKAGAEATTAEAKAAAAPTVEQAGARKAVADAGAAESGAVIKAEEAKAAPQAVALGVQKAAAEVGLTKAQTSQAVAMAKKLDAETAKAIEEAKNGDPAKNFDAELKLRKEYDAQTKGYQDTVEAHRRVLAASNDGPGDIALIYGYMKMLDPGSVVREGEFATASNSGGIPTAIQNLYNKAISGQRLTEGQRKTFAGQAGKLAEAASKREAEVREGLTTVARSYKLNTDNIFGTGINRGNDQPAPPAGGAPMTATNPKTGEKLQLVNGQWVPAR